jgi:hypothetical protein
MALSEINKLGVDLENTGFEVSASPSQAGVWSLGCDITIEDFDTDIQEIKVDDIILSGTISTNEVPVNIDYKKSSIYDLDVNVVIDGLNSLIIESQVVPFNDILGITDFSPETTNERRYASSARASKIIYDLLSALEIRVNILENEDDDEIEKLKDAIKKIQEAIENLDITNGMFYWHEKGKTIGTEYNLFSKKTIASGGVGEAMGGEGGGGSADLDSYAKLVDLEKAILDLIGGADDEYNTLGKIQNIIIGTKGDINELSLIVTGIADVVSQYNDRLIVLEDKNTMFEWVYDENGEKAGIKTTYDFFSTKTVASGGMGEYGSGDVDNTSGITGIEVNGELCYDKDGDGIIVLPDYPSRVSQLENDEGFITKDDLKDLGDSSGMFEWADEAHTIIKTRFDLYSTKTIASGGVGQHGTNTGAGSVMAIEVNGEIYDDSDSDGVIVLPNYPTRAEYNSEMTLINGRFAALDAKDESHDISIGEHSIRISTNENDIAALQQTDEGFEKRLQRAEKITNYFDIDNDDNVYTWHNLYSTKTIASGGVGEEGDSGIDTSEFVTWEYFDELTGRIDNIDEWIANAEENGIGGSSVVYYTGLTDGLRIGAITIDEVSTDVFIPANLSEYTIDSDFVNALSVEGFITEVDANNKYALQSALDDFLPKDAEASSAARLSDEDEYTAFGRTFFSNGKPVNITSSPIAPANGGLYAYDYDNNRVLLFFYANGGDFSELRIGSEPASRGEDVRICGYPLIMHHGSVNAGVVVAKTTVDGIVVPAGRKLYLGDDNGYHITMEYDEVTDAIRIDGNVYATGTLASGGVAQDGDLSGEGGGDIDLSEYATIDWVNSTFYTIDDVDTMFENFADNYYTDGEIESMLADYLPLDGGEINTLLVRSLTALDFHTQGIYDIDMISAVEGGCIDVDGDMSVWGSLYVSGGGIYFDDDDNNKIEVDEYGNLLFFVNGNEVAWVNPDGIGTTGEVAAFMGSFDELYAPIIDDIIARLEALEGK